MPGTEDGQTCGRDGCEGVIQLEEPENCSCHIAPPCPACVSCGFYCAECGWRSNDDA